MNTSKQTKKERVQRIVDLICDTRKPTQTMYTVPYPKPVAFSHTSQCDDVAMECDATIFYDGDVQTNTLHTNEATVRITFASGTQLVLTGNEYNALSKHMLEFTNSFVDANLDVRIAYTEKVVALEEALKGIAQLDSEIEDGLLEPDNELAAQEYAELRAIVARCTSEQEVK